MSREQASSMTLNLQLDMCLADLVLIKLASELASLDRYVWRVGGNHEFELPLKEGELYEKRPLGVGMRKLQLQPCFALKLVQENMGCAEATLPNSGVVRRVRATRSFHCWGGVAQAEPARG